MKISKTKNKILIILVLLLIIISLNFFVKPVKEFFYFISSPIQRFFSEIGGGISYFFGTVSDIKNLKKQNEELLSKSQELLSENTQLKELKKENEALRNALGIEIQSGFELEMAEIISKDPFQDFLLINKREKSDIKKGMPVLTSEKVVLGKISEVYGNFSKVVLISDKSSSFDAKISEKDIFGVVKGEGNFSVILDIIPQEKEIKENDLVITSSLGGIFPKGLLVGRIKEVKKSDVRPYQKATLESAFNLSNLEMVFIIKNF